MNQKKANNEFFDPEILEQLKSLGLVPPRTIKDFIKLEQELKRNPLKKPSNLENPLLFLERKQKIRTFPLSGSNLEDYQQNISYAARNGTVIPDYIKQKMKEDKKNAKKPDGK
jgi:hypothetical protein